MKINLTNLETGINTWEESIAPGDAGLKEENFKLPVNISFKVEKQIGKVNVSLRARTVGNFLCDRCCEDFSPELSGKCSVQFVQRDNPFPNEIPGDELRSFTQGQSELDVSAEIRDALLLYMPLQFLCNEDCKGLCGRCGANLNVESCQCTE